MAIPEARSTITQSASTYATVKGVLEDTSSPYYQKLFKPFLQGSYGNHTNVFRDSDIDVVIRLDSTFYHDAYTLPKEQNDAFEKAYPGSAAYGLPEFKKEVSDWLIKKFVNVVKVGSKAIFIPGNGARRDCDVLPAARFKYYYGFAGIGNERIAEGICFFTKDGTRIINFPDQHADNCVRKQKDTKDWFKPTVRMYKNMRNYMTDKGTLADGIAPSYFIEGMLCNVPTDKFGKSFEDTFVGTFNYIVAADRTTFKCAKGIHPLLQDSSQTSWLAGNCQTFLNALRNLWNNWK